MNRNMQLRWSVGVNSLSVAPSGVHQEKHTFGVTWSSWSEAPSHTISQWWACRFFLVALVQSLTVVLIMYLTNWMTVSEMCFTPCVNQWFNSKIPHYTHKSFYLTTSWKCMCVCVSHHGSWALTNTVNKIYFNTWYHWYRQCNILKNIFLV